MMNTTHEKYMKEALRMAKKGLGRTSPNPMVGAVIVRDEMIIASGYHKKAGGPHAELDALEKIGRKAKANDTLYVTLEPCNHVGRTPPCTQVILESGFKKIVVGMKDPNPGVSGNGVEFLRQKGLDVKIGFLEDDCLRLNEAYIKFVTRSRPFVIAKSAVTLDGWTATSVGHSKWITNEKSRRFVHRLRDQVDAVLVGVGTVLADDPRLTTRLKNKHGKNPVRIIVDTHLKIPHNAKVLDHYSESQTLVVVGESVPQERLKQIENDRVSTVVCPEKDGRIDLDTLMGILAGKAITSILVEGGSAIMGAMMSERLIDKWYIFKAPKILGGDDGIPMAKGKGPKMMDKALTLKNLTTRRFKDDLLITGYPDYGDLSS